MPLTQREDFLAWRDQPQTQEFLALLRDRQQSLMERWALGHQMLPQEQAEATTLGELARLRFSEADQVEPWGMTIEKLTGLDLSEASE